MNGSRIVEAECEVDAAPGDERRAGRASLPASYRRPVATGSNEILAIGDIGSCERPIGEEHSSDLSLLTR